MHYTVTAHFNQETAVEFLCKLTDGTIEKQKPDGKEIVASMKRAAINNNGVVRWSEVCYCPTPLQHERTTVYDNFFNNIQTEEVEDYVEFDGEPFMAYLAQLA